MSRYNGADALAAEACERQCGRMAAGILQARLFRAEAARTPKTPACQSGAIFSIDAMFSFLSLVMMLHLYSYLGERAVALAADDAARFEAQARVISVSDYLVAAGGAQKSGGLLEYRQAAMANVIGVEELDAAIEKLRERGLEVSAELIQMDQHRAMRRSMTDAFLHGKNARGAGGLGGALGSEIDDAGVFAGEEGGVLGAGAGRMGARAGGNGWQDGFANAAGVCANRAVVCKDGGVCRLVVCIT